MIVLLLKYLVVIQRARLTLLPHWIQSPQKENFIFVLLFIHYFASIMLLTIYFFYRHISPKAYLLIFDVNLINYDICIFSVKKKNIEGRTNRQLSSLISIVKRYFFSIMSSILIIGYLLSVTGYTKLAGYSTLNLWCQPLDLPCQSLQH